jgi:RNA polymerase sigma factor (sigma-70 family)
MHVERRLLDHGHEAARLFADHSGWLLRFCRRRLGSAADAEDAVQTTFLYALRALRRGVVPDCEEAWLTAIAKNVCLTQHRTLERRGTCVGDVDLDRIGLAVPEEGERELLMGLERALESLPEAQRTALVLRELRGAPAQEIADTLHVSSTAAQALLTRARRSLRSALVAPRSLAGIHLAPLLHRLETALRGLGEGGATKAAAATVAVAVTLGGGASPTDRQPAPDRPRAQQVGPVSAKRASPVLVAADPVTAPRVEDDRAGKAAKRPGAAVARPAPIPNSAPAAPGVLDTPTVGETPAPEATPTASAPPATAPPPADPPRQSPPPPPPVLEPPVGLLPPLPPLPPLPELPLVPPVPGEAGLPLDLSLDASLDLPPPLPDAGLQLP